MHTGNPLEIDILFGHEPHACPGKTNHWIGSIGGIGDGADMLLLAKRLLAEF